MTWPVLDVDRSQNEKRAQMFDRMCGAANFVRSTLLNRVRTLYVPDNIVPTVGECLFFLKSTFR